MKSSIKTILISTLACCVLVSATGCSAPQETVNTSSSTSSVSSQADYTGRSLSVSDVVVLHESGKDTAYYCDLAGWQEVPEFWNSLPEEQSSKEADMEVEDDFEL